MRHRRESGEVVVEASIIVTLVVIFVTIMLYVGMVLYQRTLVSVLANRTASDLAQVYSNSLKDPFTGYIDPDQVYQSVTYGNMKTDAYLQVIEQKANALAQYRLKSEKILNTGSVTVDVEIVKKPNELFKNQIVVTIHDQYDVPLVGMFDVNGGVEFAASGRADCVDYLEYMNSVEAAGEPDVILPDLDTCIVTFVVDRYSGKHHATVPVRRGQSIITSHSVTHSVMPGVPVNGPLKFTGWATADGSAFTAKREINESITVYGTWECTVTLQPEGGEVSPTTLAVPLRATTKFPTPTRFNHTFDGWFTEKDGKGIRYRSNVTQITGNVTLYAKWTCTHAANTYTLKTRGTCITKSVWTYRCDTCSYTWEETGGMEANNHFGPETKTETFGTATCERGTGVRTRCAYCSGILKEEFGSPVGHNYSARCGVDHNVSIVLGEAYHNRKDGYTKSVQVQCRTCCWCGKPDNRERDAEGARDEGWRRENDGNYLRDKKGYRVSQMVYCWMHNDEKYGNGVGCLKRQDYYINKKVTSNTHTEEWMWD